MTSLTIRNIPDEVFERIKILATTEKRSINNEMVLLLEQGLGEHIKSVTIHCEHPVSKETQLSLWKELSGKWLDNRSTNDIIDDIYASRTMGREVDL